MYGKQDKVSLPIVCKNFQFPQPIKVDHDESIKNIKKLLLNDIGTKKPVFFENQMISLKMSYNNRELEDNEKINAVGWDKDSTDIWDSFDITIEKMPAYDILLVPLFQFFLGMKEMKEMNIPSDIINVIGLLFVNDIKVDFVKDNPKEFAKELSNKVLSKYSELPKLSIFSVESKTNNNVKPIANISEKDESLENEQNVYMSNRK